MYRVRTENAIVLATTRRKEHRNSSPPIEKRGASKKGNHQAQFPTNRVRRGVYLSFIIDSVEAAASSHGFRRRRKDES